MKTLPILAAMTLVIVPALAAQEIPVPLKNAPGQETVENMCSGCHSLDYIRINSPFMDAKAWGGEVNKMVRTFGAPISDADVKTIIAYLAANYGAPTK
jgi:sulfite dehydrogenase (cytochrome) subunit B